MLNLYLTLFVIFSVSFHTFAAKHSPLNECEKRSHSSLSPQQKKELCANYDVDYSIGPAVCSIAAKDKLHLSFKDIMRLCYGAVSDGPVDCMLGLPMKQRNSLGYNLCINANSALPALCYQELSSSTSSKSSVKSGGTDLVVDFCQNLLDPAPLLCVQAATKYTKMPVTQALPLCKNSVGSGAGQGSNGQSSIPHQKSLDSLIEDDPLNALAAGCIKQMVSALQPSLGITAEAVVKFCVEINPYHYLSGSHVIPPSVARLYQTFASDCYYALTERWQQDVDRSAIVAGGGDAIKPRDRLDICLNPPNALGPVNCTIQLFSAKSKPREDRAKLSARDVKTLCQRASSSQPSECFLESFGLGNTSFRALLCHTADNAGPAHCYRKIQSVFRNDEENRLLLCVGAQSEGPAACASEAPHYLANEEKVQLCADAPVDRYREPIQCLQAVATVSKQFHGAPKRVLGYFQANLQSDEEWTSRGLLIGLCSFSESQHPLAAAECLKSSPNSLDHDDAVRMCTNVSSVEVIQHLQLCQRLIPKSWPSEAVSKLCELSESKPQVEAVVRCAMDTQRLPNLRQLLSPMDIARVCRSERAQTEEVVSCLRSVSQGIRSVTSSSSPYQLTSEAVIELCTPLPVSSVSAPPVQTNAGQCLVDVLQAFLSSQSSLQSEVPLAVCKSSPSLSSHNHNYHFLIHCLKAQHRKLLTLSDVQHCSEQKRVIHTVRVKHYWNEEDGEKALVAGRRFSIVMDLFDQYHQLYTFATTASSGATEIDRPLFKISINENNPQGAILWGNRMNSSQPTSGRLSFHHLVISQPGKVEVRIAQINPSFFSTAAASLHVAARRGAAEVIGSFQMTVHEDPQMSQTRPCLYVFSENICPSDGLGSDFEALFPLTRQYLSSKYYLANIVCATPTTSGHASQEGETDEESSLSKMRVTPYLSPIDGSMWIEYKLGLDSIWTGVGLPTLEMPPLQRLQVVLPSSLLIQESISQPTGPRSQSEKYRLERAKRQQRAASDEKEDQLSEDSASDSDQRRKRILKLIKRGYYRSSLQWHPDRWMAYDQYYQAAIAAVFPLITQAYEQLVELYGREE